MSVDGSDPVRIAALIADRIAELPSRDPRNLVAIAGPPGVGKSTVAALALEELRRRGHAAALVPMDGFHLDNGLLVERGLLSRKGAPETFDVAGFRSLIGRLTRESEVVYPTFDRHLDKAIAGSGCVTGEHTTVLVEGNYLLLDEPEWRDLRSFWSLAVYLTAPVEELERRLTQRWLDHGLDPRSAMIRAESNDLPNARRIAAARLSADLVIG